MREILFRGKRVINGEWVYGDLDKTSEPPIIFISWWERDGVFICDDVIPETVGQYTGLTDKNGTKIFEGDIIRSGDVVHQGEVQIKGEIFTIEFVQGAFVAVDKTRHGMYLTKEVAGKTEVIGNIHDNPELLEENNA